MSAIEERTAISQAIKENSVRIELIKAQLNEVLVTEKDIARILQARQIKDETSSRKTMEREARIQAVKTIVDELVEVDIDRMEALLKKSWKDLEER